MNSPFNETESQSIQDKIFTVDDEAPRPGSWWWWFWLFFFENPNNPNKPRQLMILWSTKMDKAIYVNDVKMVLDHSLGKQSNWKKIDGAVASWYFDGEKMHHNYILEHTPLEFNEKNLICASKRKTQFSAGKKDEYFVDIGKDIHFTLKLKDKNEFTQPIYRRNDFLKKFNYKILKINKFNLEGTVDGKPTTGTAYFQRVFVNAPVIPWFWGIYHFENGGILTYMRPYILTKKKAVKSDIRFFDGEKMHWFNNNKIKRDDKFEYPIFFIEGENEDEKIQFQIHAYEHSSWKFDKKLFGLGPKTTLTYNEYPATVHNFILQNHKTGERIVQKHLGKGVGNAEHATGFLT